MLGASVVAQGWSPVPRRVPRATSASTGPESVGYGSPLRPAGVPARRGADRAGQHRHQGVDAGQPRRSSRSSCSSCCSSSWPASASSTAPTTRPFIPPSQPARRRKRRSSRRSSRPCSGFTPTDVRRARHRVRRLARLLRLHRLRRRRDDRRGGQEPAARPADRHHRLARHLHGALLRRRARHHGDDPVRPDLQRGGAGDRVRDRGQDRLRHLDRRRSGGRADHRRHDPAHRRLAGDLRDVRATGCCRPPSARSTTAPAPRSGSPLDRRRRGAPRGAHPRRHARVHGQHRHARRLHARVDRRAGAAAQARPTCSGRSRCRAARCCRCSPPRSPST